MDDSSQRPFMYSHILNLEALLDLEPLFHPVHGDDILAEVPQEKSVHLATRP
jgi:hypothetical protein